MSWDTGAPAKRARALGLHDLMNGTAAKPAPTAPTTAVVAVRNRRRPVLTSSLAIPHSERKLHENTLRLVGANAGRTQKTGKCNGTLNEPTIRPAVARPAD